VQVANLYCLLIVLNGFLKEKQLSMMYLHGHDSFVFVTPRIIEDPYLIVPKFGSLRNFRNYVVVASILTKSALIKRQLGKATLQFLQNIQKYIWRKLSVFSA